MACDIDPEEVKSGEQKVGFSYCFKPGVASHSFGIYVAECAGINSKVLQIAARKAQQFNDNLANVVRQLQPR
jgi:DNA mismatch repair ATPase MutS